MINVWKLGEEDNGYERKEKEVKYMVDIQVIGEIQRTMRRLKETMDSTGILLCKLMTEHDDMAHRLVRLEKSIETLCDNDRER